MYYSVKGHISLYLGILLRVFRRYSHFFESPINVIHSDMFSLTIATPETICEFPSVVPITDKPFNSQEPGELQAFSTLSHQNISSLYKWSYEMAEFANKWNQYTRMGFMVTINVWVLPVPIYVCHISESCYQLTGLVNT
uniref:Uncharacterized protein n=1 Tax=Rhizophagus irregularis (strain DAOM 181602 / DAOM 197198 / MUCL 43194) TaxID=747089 RepID=U9SQU3_RHIID